MGETISSAYSWKKWCCIILGVAIIFGFKYLTPFQGLDQNGMDILGIFVGTIFLWLTVSTTWPALITLIALTMNPTMTFANVLSRSWGNWVVPFIIYSAVCADVLGRSGFLKRSAIFFISRPLAKKGPWYFVFLLFISTLLVGCIMESMTLFIVMMAMVEEIFQAVGWTKGDRAPAMIVLGIMMTTSISSAMTPIGHTFVILSMSMFSNDTGTLINFFSYSIMGIISGLIGFAIMFIVLKYVYRPNLSALEKVDISKMVNELPPFSKNEILSLLIFGGVIMLWFAPGFLMFVWPAGAKFINGLGSTVPAMIGIIAFSLVNINGKPMINFGDAMKHVPWNAVNLVAATQAMSTALTGKGSKITVWMTNLISPLVGDMSVIVYVILVGVLAGFVTNFISSTVNVTMFYGIFIPIIIAKTISIDVNPAALACIIGATSSLAFGAPSGRAHASLAAGTGWFSLRDMLFYGTSISVLISFIYSVVGYPVASLFM